MIEKLVLFTYVTCGHCNSLKKRLTDESIPFLNVDVVENRSDWLLIVEQIGIDIIPTVYIKDVGNDPGTFFQPGRDFKDEDEMVEIIKKHIG